MVPKNIRTGKRWDFYGSAVMLRLNRAPIKFRCPVCEKDSSSELSRWYQANSCESWVESCVHCGQDWELLLTSKPINGSSI